LSVGSRLKTFLKNLGPGVITGASDDDPSGIATYSQAGAQAGFATLWTALVTFPLMAAVQEMSARIGLVTDRGLSGNLRRHFPRPVLYFLALLVFVANTINIGADIAGMAAAANLILPAYNLVYVILFAIVITALMIWLPYPKIASILKWLTLGLFTYLAVPFVTHVDWNEVIKHTILPSLSFDRGTVTLLVAILGTTISPYLFFWQANMEVQDKESRQRSVKRWIVTKHELRLMEEDVTFGMFISNVVMWFIIITTASTLYFAGITNIETADQAASALKPVAGQAAYLLFSLGIIGTGFLAIPVLAGSAAYVLSEIFGWSEGLEKSFRQAKSFYLVIIFATLIGASLSFLGLNPIKLLFYTAVIYGLVSPPLIFVIWLIANNKQIMGSHTNGWLSNILVGATFVVMTAGAAAFI
jgi:NRAMP (natural resistance-associated macrophage protein)-like metal ion transporter